MSISSILYTRIYIRSLQIYVCKNNNNSNLDVQLYACWQISRESRLSHYCAGIKNAYKNQESNIFSNKNMFKLYTYKWTARMKHATQMFNDPIRTDRNIYQFTSRLTYLIVRIWSVSMFTLTMSISSTILHSHELCRKNCLYHTSSYSIKRSLITSIQGHTGTKISSNRSYTKTIIDE
jgi:hypothetical protein